VNRTSIEFELPPQEAQSLHDFLNANGILCPGPRYSEQDGVSYIRAVARGSETDVRRAEAALKVWHESRETQPDRET